MVGVPSDSGLFTVFGFVSSFGVVWRFRVVELCSGFSRVVFGLFTFVSCLVRFTFVWGSGSFRVVYNG